MQHSNRYEGSSLLIGNAYLKMLFNRHHQFDSVESHSGFLTMKLSEPRSPRGLAMALDYHCLTSLAHRSYLADPLIRWLDLSLATNGETPSDLNSITGLHFYDPQVDAGLSHF